MSGEKPLMTRKEIASMIGQVNARQVGYNEKRWGLHRARVELPTRLVLYRRAQAIRILVAQGVAE